MERLTSSLSLVRTAVLSCGALVFLVPAAHARAWHILDYKDGTCEAAEAVSPEASTPEQFHTQLRDDGTTDEVKVKKLPIDRLLIA
jgi:hypothetical protein